MTGLARNLAYFGLGGSQSLCSSIPDQRKIGVIVVKGTQSDFHKTFLSDLCASAELLDVMGASA
jgi:hypothetical protein